MRPGGFAGTVVSIMSIVPVMALLHECLLPGAESKRGLERHRNDQQQSNEDPKHADRYYRSDLCMCAPAYPRRSS